MEKEKYYFAYGSNINTAQMKIRCPQAKIIGTGFIENYELQFKKYATIKPTDKAKTPVLIWKINRSDEQSLDRYEGYPNCYDKQKFTVKLNGKTVTGMTYIMSKISPEISPSAKYYKRISDGYKQAGFDTAYLDKAVSEAKFAELNRERLYIAYGANLNREDMAMRCPDAKIVTIGEIPDYRLQFKGCAAIAPQKGSAVPVLLWNISKKDEQNLDRFECYPNYYRKEFFNVGVNSERLAMVYIMNGNSPLSPPDLSYFDTIARGYEQTGFDLSVLENARSEAVFAYESMMRKQEETEFEEEIDMYSFQFDEQENYANLDGNQLTLL